MGVTLETGLVAALALVATEALVLSDNLKANGMVASRNEALDFNVDIKAWRGET